MEKGCCRICGSLPSKVFDALLLGKHSVAYHQCGECGFLQTDPPHWLEEAYRHSINHSDTGILSRNFHLCRMASVLLRIFFPKHGSYLDFAGGYGLFVRLMRDEGFDFRWQDLYTQNLFARGFERSAGDVQPISLVTSFESFEHFVDPMPEIGKMLETSRNILFTTELLPSPLPEPGEWWYYGLEHGQHISFYTERTLAWIARKFGLNFRSAYGLHLFTEKAIHPLAFKLILRLARAEIRPSNWFFGKMPSRTFDDMIDIARALGKAPGDLSVTAPGSTA